MNAKDSPMPDYVAKHGIDVNGHAYTRQAKAETGPATGALGGAALTPGAPPAPLTDAAETDELDADALYEDLKAKIQERDFHLARVDPSVRLTAAQVQVLLEGKSIQGEPAWKQLADSMEEQALNVAWGEYSELVDNEQHEALEEGGQNVDLVRLIQDNDRSDWVDDAVRLTRPMPFSYAAPEGMTFQAEDFEGKGLDPEDLSAETVSERTREVAQALGVSSDDLQGLQACQTLAEQSLRTGGSLEIAWIGEVTTALDVAHGNVPGQFPKGYEPGDHDRMGGLRITNASLVLRDAQGYPAESVHLQQVRVPWVTGYVNTDESGSTAGRGPSNVMFES